LAITFIVQKYEMLQYGLYFYHFLGFNYMAIKYKRRAHICFLTVK